MGIGKFLFLIPLLATASAQYLNDPWLRDPLLVGLWKLTRAMNSFGFNLFEDLAIAEEGNVLICPYSLATALGILHFGANGDTEKELTEVLGYASVNLTKDEAAQTFYLLATKHLKSSNPKFYVFDAPSTVVVNRKNGLLPTFQRTVEVLFQAPVTVSDFLESGEELTQSLNEWVAARTKNKIQDIVSSVDPFSDMIVLNAAFFKGIWVHKFSPQETQPGVFYNYGEHSQSKTVQMMHMTEVLSYHKDYHHSVLELPFKGRNVSMLIFLPDSFNGIEELQFKFSPQFFEQQIMQMTRSDVEVILPKFKIRFEQDLTGNLQGLGAETLFHPERVDLSHMIRRDTLTLGEVYHKTMVSVSESGVEAAAATAIFSFKSFPPVLDIPDFLVDHPFLFVIYERRIKLILFVGRVMEL